MADLNPQNVNAPQPGAQSANSTDGKQQTPNNVTDEKASQRLLLFTQREKKAVELEKSARLRIQEAEAKFGQLSEREKKIQEFESLKETNPMKALELLGLSYDQLTKTALNDGKVTPDIEIARLRDEIQSLRKERDQDKVQAAENSKALAADQETQVIDSFKKDINKFLDDNQKKYETIRFEQKAEEVYNQIDKHYNDTLDPETGVGVIMSIAEACDKLESDIRQKYQNELTKTEFFKSLLPQQLNAAKQPHRPNSPEQPRTLTNNNSATVTQPRKTPVSDEEKVRAAIANVLGSR